MAKTKTATPKAKKLKAASARKASKPMPPRRAVPKLAKLADALATEMVKNAKTIDGKPAFQAPAAPIVPKRKAAQEAAERGVMPTPPDFTADTHKPHRAKLAKLVELAAARDAAGLRAVAINPTSTSPKALLKFRDLAITAIEAAA